MASMLLALIFLAGTAGCGTDAPEPALTPAANTPSPTESATENAEREAAEEAARLEAEREAAEEAARLEAEQAAAEEAARLEAPPPDECHPSYDPCVPIASDVDCEGGSGDGPLYTGRVRVIGPDEYDLDRDGDGVGCEN
ncbi:MAG TPA: hypothetical protein VK908_13895 [Jiangellales bacterium]|nr:hypothetical protein [Jiangellales bacterium]